MRPVLSLAILIAFLLGCDSKPDDRQVDPAPFRAALEDHMARNKWDVKIDEFESISKSGSSATAVVRVTHKESTGLKPKWTVEFVEKDGKWVVEKVDR